MIRAAGKIFSLDRDQRIVLGCLLGITALAWLYLAQMAQEMGEMADMADMPDMANMAGKALVMPQAQWAAADFAMAASMWIVMMIGMMLPSAVPMILLFAAVQRRQTGRPPLAMTAIFVGGYFLVWGGFSLAATVVHWALIRGAVLSPDVAMASAALGGAIFIAAGLYEWSPLKYRCLAHCQGPLAFIAAYWRPGLRGALRMGAEHGAFCLGCCWVLMLLLFALGVMNLLWVAGLAALVLLQKVVPGGRIVAQATGLGMVAAGLFLIGRAIPL